MLPNKNTMYCPALDSSPSTCALSKEKVEYFFYFHMLSLRTYALDSLITPKYWLSHIPIFFTKGGGGTVYPIGFFRSRIVERKILWPESSCKEILWALHHIWPEAEPYSYEGHTDGVVIANCKLHLVLCFSTPVPTLCASSKGKIEPWTSTHCPDNHNCSRLWQLQRATRPNIFEICIEIKQEGGT